MSSIGQTHNLARNDGSSSLATDPSAKYTPQFSAATQMIIERIHSGNSGPFSSIGISTTTTPPPGYEDMRRSVLQNMRTSMNINIQSIPTEDRKMGAKSIRSSGGNRSSVIPSGSSVGSGGKGKAVNRKSRSKTSGKRKRTKSESDGSEEESDENMSKLGGDSGSDDSEVAKPPKVTQSGRQIVKPTQFVPAVYDHSSKRRSRSRKVREQVLCKTCGRGHSPQNNLIVFCDGCNLPWHQKCHDPFIADNAVQVESILWFCTDCSRKKGIISRYETSPKGVSWVGRSMQERKAYLCSQSHSQLVTLLLQATYLHPDIPLFPSPVLSKATQSYLQNIQPASISNPSIPGHYPNSESNPCTPMNFIQTMQSPAPHGALSHMQASSAPPTMPTQDRQLSRESTPASPPYPRPENGLMSKLGPEDEDLDWLVDSNDFTAFSHAVIENSDRREAKLSKISDFNLGMADVNVDGRVSLNGMRVGV